MGLNSILVEELLPIAAMVILECLIVGLNTTNKAAMSKGMSRCVYVFYSTVLATLIMLPLSAIFNRKRRPSLSFSILRKFFVISLIVSTINPNCQLAGIDYSSPTLASAMRDLIPAFTFLLAVVFRMEKLNLRSSRSLIKIIATLISISGAFILTLYKGPPIGSAEDGNLVASLKSSTQSQNFFSHLLRTGNSWIIGGLFLAFASLCVSIWIIAQGAILKECPSKMTVVTFYFLFGSIQSGAIALVVERNHPNAWKLRPDIELISIIYSAVFGCIGLFFVEMWCIQKKGPVFVSMFKPLSIAIAAVVNSIFLGERLHVGTIIGSVIIIIGFYGVLWAKFKENGEKGEPQVDSLCSSSRKLPLLQNNSDV